MTVKLHAVVNGAIFIWLLKHAQHQNYFSWCRKNTDSAYVLLSVTDVYNVE